MSSGLSVKPRALAAVATVATALVIGLLMGLRPPNLWSMTHMLFTYDLGLVKRGLVGEVLSLFQTSYSYRSLATISLVIFGTWVALLCVFVSSLNRHFPQSYLLLSAFFLCSGFVYLAHTVGYFDHVGLLICLLCLFLPVSPKANGLRLILCTVLLFVHEGLLLTAFPVILFDLVLRTVILKGDWGWRAFLHPALVSAVAVALAVVFGQTTLDPTLKETVLSGTIGRAADFPVRSDAVDVLFRDAAANQELMDRVFGDKGLRTLVEAIAGSIPFTVAMLVLVGSATRGLLWPQRRLVLALAVLCSLAPLLTLILAWDFHRFAAFTQTSATLILFSTMNALPRGEKFLFPTAPMALLAGATFLCWAFEPALFDGYEVRRPPFLDTLQFVGSWLVGAESLPDIPRR